MCNFLFSRSVQKEGTNVVMDFSKPFKNICKDQGSIDITYSSYPSLIASTYSVPLVTMRAINPKDTLGQRYKFGGSGGMK